MNPSHGMPGRYEAVPPTLGEGEPTALSTDNKGVLNVNVLTGGTGGSGTQYTDGDAAVTHPVGTIPVFNNSGTITAVSAANPLPVSATISTAGLATSTKQSDGSQKTQVVDGSGNVIGATSNALDVNIKSGASSGAVAQGSTTSGQTGGLVQAAVTTAAPTYTTAQTSPLSLTTAGALRTDSSGTTQPVSGTVTALGGASVDVTPSTQNITVVDSVSATTTGANGQPFVTGVPTAGSAASFTLSGYGTVRVQVSGVWTGTLVTEVSVDGGTVWSTQGIHQSGTSLTAALFTGNFSGGTSVAAVTNFRVRATATVTGTATVKVIESVNSASVYVANAAPSGSIVSINNTTSATLLAAAVYTGTGEDVMNYTEMRINVFSNVASATDGLSLQQSIDNTNWDITDTYTIAAATGKTITIPRQARYFRIVYTNGGTNQTSFRLQTILDRNGTTPSSQRPSDGYTNETDLVQEQSFLMGYNGATWDRIRTVGTGVLSTSAVLTVGTASIGKVSDITTSVVPGTAATNLGKAEDAAHTTGDTGVFTLGVRNDGAATAFSDTNGDYTPIGVEADGSVHVVQKAQTATLANVASSATSVTLLAANNSRKAAEIYNDSTQILYVKFGTTASSTSFTVPLAASTYYEVPGGYVGRIDGIWVSANGNARVTEIT